jgi:hypothetical protein
MTLALTFAAIRRHPCSVLLTLLLVSVGASLIRLSVPVALSVWAAVGLLSLELWYALEPTVLKRLGGYRDPTYAECQRLESSVGRAHVRVLIAEKQDLVAARGLRCLVVSRDIMEVFEDRALTGIVTQAATSVQAANLAGFVMVWLGNLPVLFLWVVSRVLAQFGRLLAVVVGVSLVLPLVFCRDVFLCWTGRLFTAMLVGLIGSVLVSEGHAAVGLGMLLAWLIVPSLRAVLAWESRRAEAAADTATIAAGFGLQLLEAVDFLALAEPLPVADKLLGVLCLPRSAAAQRAERIRRAVAASHRTH